METPLFILGMLVSLWLLTRERIGWLSLLLGLIILVRPEGVLWALAVVTVLFVQRRRPTLINCVPGVAVLAAWAAASVSYYGSPIPHSMCSKCGLIVPFANDSMASRAWSTFLSLSLLGGDRTLGASALAGLLQSVAGVLLLAFFIVGAVRLVRQRSTLLAFPVLHLAYVVLYVVSRARLDFSWYGIPSGLACVVTAAVGLAHTGRRLFGTRRFGRAVSACSAALAALLVIVTVSTWRAGRFQYYQLMRTSYEAAGRLIDEVAPLNASVLVDEVGMIGYRSQRFVRDLDGIVAPDLMEFRISRGWWCPLSEIVQAFEPNYIVVSRTHARRLREGDANGWVGDNYETLAEFPGHVVLGRVAPGS